MSFPARGVLSGGLDGTTRKNVEEFSVNARVGSAGVVRSG
jgi:hypothetical protein